MYKSIKLVSVVLLVAASISIKANATGCLANLPEDVEFVANQVYGCNGAFSGGMGGAAPLCDVGYDICDSVTTLTNLGLTSQQCGGLPDDDTFFAANVGGSGGLTCSISGTDGVFGCAKNVVSSNDDITEQEFGNSFSQCGPLVAALTSSSIQPGSEWFISNSNDELNTINHTGSMGGVLCCANAPPPPPPPQITSVTLSSGPLVQQLTLDIAGTNLVGTVSTPDSGVLGGESCVLITSTATLVRCHVPTELYVAESLLLTVDGNTSNSVQVNYIPVDSDRDGLTDDEETQLLGTLPDDADSDDDGLSDGNEVLGAGTNPNLADSDDDGKTDIEELAAGSDPTDPKSLPNSGKEIPATGIFGMLILVMGLARIGWKQRRQFS